MAYLGDWTTTLIGAAHRQLYPNNVKLNYNEEVSFDFPYGETVSSTRFWPKMGCDSNGQGCTLGSSGGPGQSCPPQGCAPPVDSKFEATWGDRRMAEPVDWWDTSGVDGYTLPYTLELDSRCPRGVSLDCRALTFADCPKSELLNGRNVSLLLLDPRSGKPSGCYSPCGKLTYSNWGNSPVVAPAHAEAQMYCCPTPPVTPQQCMRGPVEHSQFVNIFRQKCKGVYSYAYDDVNGLQTCPEGTTYRWTLHCPA